MLDEGCKSEEKKEKKEKEEAKGYTKVFPLRRLVADLRWMPVSVQSLMLRLISPDCEQK